MKLKPQITEKEIELINKLMSDNPTWGRTKLSIELCNIWDWKYADGRPKDISCRDMLRRLDKKGVITLPPRQSSGPKPGYSKSNNQLMLHDTTNILCNIKKVIPLRVEVVKERTYQNQEFKSLVEQYHYLGFDMTVGENLKYMFYSSKGKLLACMLFGSSAWSCAPRDNFVGWNPSIRKANLIFTTNNTRFLVLPWVKVPHLASHILGLVSRRVSFDWQHKYGHPLHMLETFVEKNRFQGTCYKAANWIHLGETKGRSRNDRYNKLKVPIKDIYVYPLSKNFREVLSNAPLT